MRKGLTLWFTGLSGAGKSTLSVPVAALLAEHGHQVEVLDGDEVRTHLSKGLSFSKEDRDTNIRRIGWVAKTLSKHGIVAITAAISPYREIRDEVRTSIEKAGAGFVEVFVTCPIDVLAERDVKGLYKKAIAGEIKHFTGVSDPYEPPTNPDVVVDSSKESIDQSIRKIADKLKTLGYLG
ncbi:MAG: adenylyl-sulfate kinase [Gammaproteobacteria bacterium]|nr:adenylyl-sulfate kinase [Gammaproteobacteria bacterium]